MREVISGSLSYKSRAKLRIPEFVESRIRADDLLFYLQPMIPHGCLTVSKSFAVDTKAISVKWSDLIYYIIDFPTSCGLYFIF